MRYWIVLIGLGIAMTALCGCERALFTEGQPRSPYDRYLVLRGQARPATEQNAYGGEVPNLRARLQPLDTP